MTLAIIQYREFLQFSCFTEDPRAMPELVECAGLAFFTALSITDVILPDSNSQLFFNPDLSFPQLENSPENSRVGQPLSNYQHFSSLLLVPAKGLTFANSGLAPMLIFRRVDVPAPPSTPTVMSYQASPGDLVVFAPNNPSPIPTTNKADPSNF
jgi:hypothetical protein